MFGGFQCNAFQRNAYQNECVEAEPVGGHYWPTKRGSRNYREELDERSRREREELRELIERAAGLIADAEEIAPAESPAFTRQVSVLKEQLDGLQAQVTRPDPEPLFAVQQRVDRLLALAVDALIVQIADVLTDVIQEIAEDDD